MGERFVERNGARLWCTGSGAGTPLVLFNGGPGCDDYLGPVARMIEDRSLVIRFEPRGCGRSSWDGRYDVATFIEDAEAIRVGFGVDRWIVAGHSAGPNYALAYTLRHPDRVLGLIGIAGGSLANDRDWSAAYRKRLEEVGEDDGGIVFTADARVNPEMNASWKAYIKQPNILRAVCELDTPAVFINAERDIRPNWPTQQLADLLPNGRYVEIQGAAHNIWLTHALELARELNAAVDEIARAYGTAAGAQDQGSANTAYDAARYSRDRARG